MNDPSLPSPMPVMSGLIAYQISSALRTAIEIDLFTSIATGHRTAEALAVRCNVAPRGARILADFLVMNGYLTKQGNTYGLSEVSRHYLDRLSPHYIGLPVQFVQSPFVLAQFDRLTQWVREGGARPQVDALAPNHDLWITFARVMVKEMAITAHHVVPVIRDVLKNRMQKSLKILDVAAGHGMFGIVFAQMDPTCRVTAQDWPQVLEVTRQHAAEQGVANRFTWLAGDIRQVDIGTGYDVILLPNLIHYLDRTASVELLKRIRGALTPGGLVAVVEFAANEDRISPLYASFALFAFAISPGGDVYTVNEIAAMCMEAGFMQPSGWDVGMERLFIAENPPA